MVSRVTKYQNGTPYEGLPPDILHTKRVMKDHYDIRENLLFRYRKKLRS